MEKLEFDAPISEFKSVRINIKAGYEWGKGWTSEEAMRKFSREIYPALRRLGYDIEYPEYEMSCPILKDNRNAFNKMDIYMHPMEFTGLATTEQINDMMSVLGNAECVKSATLKYAHDLYEMSPNEYRDVLIQNSPEIYKWIQSYKLGHRYSHDIGFEFARQFRPPLTCFKESVGYKSDDLDVSFIDSMSRTMDQIEKAGKQEKQATFAKDKGFSK